MKQIAIILLCILLVGCDAALEMRTPSPTARPTAAPTLPPAPVPVATAETATVSGMWNCRETGSTAGEVLAVLGDGQWVIVLQRTGEWAEIEASGLRCWVREEALR